MTTTMFVCGWVLLAQVPFQASGDPPAAGPRYSTSGASPVEAQPTQAKPTESTPTKPPPTSPAIAENTDEAQNPFRLKSAPPAEFSAEAAAPQELPTSPLVPVRDNIDVRAADRLIRAALTPPDQDMLAGQPASLASLLPNREMAASRHAELVQLYWRLSHAVARYHFARDEAQRLDEATAGATDLPPSVALALAVSTAQRKHAEFAAVNLQHDAAEALAWPVESALPFPADRPVVGAYRTYYDAIFSGRPAARQARKLHETLPLVLAALAASADAAEAADRQLATALAKQQDGSSGWQDVLSALDQLRQQRRDFLDGVLNYNVSIAQYAVLAAASGTTADALLPMLIKSPSTPATPNQPLSLTRPQQTPNTPSFPALPSAGESRVIQAGAEESVTQPAPPTIAEPQPPLVIPPSDNRQPPLRSVLVPEGSE